MTLVFYIFGGLFSTFFKSNQKKVLTQEKYAQQHLEAQSFCKQNKMHAGFYFLLDFSIHSGKNRFFIYDFKQKKIIKSALVTHGTCDVLEPNPTAYEKAKFSNKNNSHCSSLGKYKIGKRDYSSWGINIKYWLHGLESTNNKAVERVVVLHSWSVISDTEIFPNYSALSWGCPAVSDEFMRHLDSLLKKTTQPVLLWIIQ